MANPLESIFFSMSYLALFEPLKFLPSMVTTPLEFLASFVKGVSAMFSISQESGTGSCLVQTVTESFPPMLAKAIRGAWDFLVKVIIIAPVKEELLQRWFITQVKNEIFEDSIETCGILMRMVLRCRFGSGLYFADIPHGCWHRAQSLDLSMFATTQVS